MASGSRQAHVAVLSSPLFPSSLPLCQHVCKLLKRFTGSATLSLSLTVFLFPPLEITSPSFPPPSLLGGAQAGDRGIDRSLFFQGAVFPPQSLPSIRFGSPLSPHRGGYLRRGLCFPPPGPAPTPDGNGEKKSLLFARPDSEERSFFFPPSPAYSSDHARIGAGPFPFFSRRVGG